MESQQSRKAQAATKCISILVEFVHHPQCGD